MDGFPSRRAFSSSAMECLEQADLAACNSSETRLSQVNINLGCFIQTNEEHFTRLMTTLIRMNGSNFAILWRRLLAVTRNSFIVIFMTAKKAGRCRRGKRMVQAVVKIAKIRV